MTRRNFGVLLGLTTMVAASGCIGRARRTRRRGRRRGRRRERRREEAKQANEETADLAGPPQI